MSGDREEFNSEKFAETILTPRGFLRLLDDTVFQFNDIYRRFWRNGGDSLSRAEQGAPKESWVVPAMFDKQSRTFNWVALADPLLESEHTSRHRSKKITKVVKEFHSVFKNNDILLNEFKSLFDDSPHSSEAIQILTAEIEIYSKYGCPVLYESHLSENPVHAEDVFYAFASIYSSYSHPRQHSFEGCLFKALEKFGHTQPHVVQDAIFGDVNGGFIQLENWRKSRALSEESWSLISWNAEEIVTIEEPRIIKGKSYYYQPCRKTFSDLVFNTMLENAYMSWDIDLDTSGKPITLSEHLASHNFVLLMPIYDVWIGSVGYGGLQAVLLIFLKPPKKEERAGKIGHTRWENVYRKKILDRCEGFAEKLAGIAIRRAIATPIAPPYDLVSHFLKILAEVQDWEEAVVYRGSNPSYCFRRSGPLKVDSADPTQHYLRVRIPWELDEALTHGMPAGPQTQSGSIVIDSKEMYMWWTCEQGTAENASRPHYNLWSDYFLPELTDEERLAFQDISIRFKFPKACRIPLQCDTYSRDYLVETYLKQQLELMRALIPKVRARRAALRNAVSAIMGRNMSHNIGSHVLARYASHVVVKKDIVSDRLDPRADFLSYLQRRMDFLAEVSTTDRAYWTQPLSLKQQLDRLNYAAQVEIFKEKADIPGRFPPLLEYITGKDNLRATVCMKAVDDICQANGTKFHDAFMLHTEANKRADHLVFSCPGGEVGVHALYVILENVIRNSARHNGQLGGATRGSPEEVQIDVTIEPSELDGLIKLRIWDKRSRLRSDGSVDDDTRAIRPKWTYAGGAKLKERWKRLETDKKGKREFPAVPDRINWIIQHEPILDRDGTPEPHNWGVREMQICAQYLRQLPLSDLENMLVADRDAMSLETSDRGPQLSAECSEYKDGSDTKYCLTYVIYLPQATLCATVSAAAQSEGTSWEVVRPGFAEFKLSAADLVGRESAQPDSALAQGLARISNYSFVDFSDEPSVADWVGHYQDRLPVRCVPSSAIAKGEHNDFDNPIEAMEGLHEAYSLRIARLPENHRLAGFAIAGDGLGEAQKHLCEDKFGSWSNPISCAVGDWSKWAKSFGQVTLHTAFWIDHIKRHSIIKEENISTLHETIANFNRQEPSIQIECLGWEPCFFGLPASVALNGLKRNQGWELMAASLPRVVVLDERVQAQADTPFRSIPLSEYWKGMRVEVPSKSSCDLDQPIMEICRNWLITIDKPVDFLIIHLTMLDRLRDELGFDDGMAAIAALIRGIDLLAHAEIAVVTGRGVATFGRSLSEPTRPARGPRPRYLPVSAFLEYLVRRPSKLGLMRVLWSASKPKGKQWQTR